MNGEDLTGSRSYANYKGLKFIAYGSEKGWYRIEMRGSVHRLYNNGQDNSDDFDKHKLSCALGILRTELGIHTEKEILNNLEFGVNIKLTCPVSRVLSNLLTYKGIPFERIRGDISYYQCETNQFTIKIYDKATQFKLSGNILRFEIRVKTMAFLRNKGIMIKVIDDLLDPVNYQKLGTLLVKCFDRILFRNDDIDLGRLTVSERELFLRGCLKEFWERPFLPDFEVKTQYESARKMQVRLENKFRSRFAFPMIADISQLIKQKWAELAHS
ncbi:hypothetical protein [Dyadobacter aurulentus]|uniref:hypothetical protein n=1 Tax=Dyadobacter sp. UC 10 TaxID=2605428 RepID=UPI001788DD5C|nr:hypothetical protein [Dyadobacter sp. UC 10]